MTFEIFDEKSMDFVDITPYIKVRGLKWQRADVEGENATRNLDGSLVRDRRAIATRWDVTCRPLTSAEARIVLRLILPEKIRVRCDDPLFGDNRERDFYSNNIPASYLINRDGVDYWDGIVFPIIEVKPITYIPSDLS